MATAAAVPIPNIHPNLLPSPFPAPEIHTYSIVKKNDSSPIGIRMEQTLLRKLLISGIDEKSPLARSGAAVGQEILRVNGSIPDTPQTAATLIRSTPPHGTVTLVTADPTRSPLYKLVAVSPSKVRWTCVRDGTLLRISRVFSRASLQTSTQLAEGDILLAIQGRPVSTVEEARCAVQAVTEEHGDETFLSFYVLDHQLLRDSIWKALLQRIRANRYKELEGEYLNVNLKPIADTFEDRPDVYGIFFHHKLKARVVLDRDTYRMMDPWQYWSAHYINGRIDHDSAIDYHRNSYQKVLAVMREYNRILEHNLRNLEEIVCQECWRSGHLVAASRTPMVAEFASIQVEEDGDDDDCIPLATATYF